MQLEPEQKKKLLILILGAVCAALLLIGCVILALGVGGGDDPALQSSGVSVPENELLVSDLYDGPVLIPKFDLKKSEVNLQKFTEKNGLRSYQDSRASLGVDVSEFQGQIDWNAVKGSDVEFAMLRVGYRGTTKGQLFLDEYFEQNFQGASDAGLDIGVYFFSQAVTEEEAKEEAQFVLDTLNGRKLQYPVAFDWELPVNSDESFRVQGVKGEDAARYGAVFCEEIKAGGYRPIVYSNKYSAYEFFDLNQWKDYDLWYAEYHEQPSLYYDYRMWQYTDEGTVPGISGGVDLNICFKAY